MVSVILHSVQSINPGEALCELRESTEKNAINIYVPPKGRDALALE